MIRSVARHADNKAMTRLTFAVRDVTTAYMHAVPAQGLGKLGLGLRPHQKTKFCLGKKAPLFIIKGPNFYKIIYIF